MTTLAAIIIPGGLAGLAITLIVFLAIAAIVVVASRAMGVAPPAWLIQLFWILVAAVVCIAAVRFVAGL